MSKSNSVQPSELKIPGSKKGKGKKEKKKTNYEEERKKTKKRKKEKERKEKQKKDQISVFKLVSIILFIHTKHLNCRFQNFFVQFGFATPLDTLLLCLGVCSAIGCGTAVPLMTIRFVRSSKILFRKILFKLVFFSKVWEYTSNVC